MSKRKGERASAGGRESEEEEEDYQQRLSQTGATVTSQQEFHYSEPGTSHRMYPAQTGHVLPMGEQLGMQGLSQPPSLRTRGPGRPRIHPLKPAGVSRPRGRPKGSKNKKPRKRIERPPKRPRGRPRKWPPEMWEGFQRTREAAVQQQLKHQHQQQLHQHQQDIPGPSHMYMEQPGESLTGMQQMAPDILHHHHYMQQQQQQQHSTLQHHPHQHHQQQSQPHMPHYMQLPLETEQPQELALVMPRQTIPQALSQSSQQIMSPLILPGGSEPSQGTMGDPEELLWMQQLPPEDLPPHTTS